MNPSFEVNIWDFNEETKTIKLLVLMTWCTALKSELKGFQVSATEVFPIVRKFLSVPSDYPDDMLYQHVQDSYDNIKEQLGMQG